MELSTIVMTQNIIKKYNKKYINKINQCHIKSNIRTRELSQHVSAAYLK